MEQFEALPSKAGKLDNFEILTAEYKTVGESGIEVHVLIPKSLPKNTNAPVIVRFHGGGFVTGSSLYAPWFPLWVLELATAQNAIMVSPNYRLLPESSGKDFLDDLDDLWSWLHSTLPHVLRKSEKEGVSADLGRIVTAGDSAGGYMSITFALDHSDKILACTADFPSLDFGSPPMSEPESAPGSATAPGPPLPETYVEDHLAASKPGQIVSSDMEIGRFPLIFAMTQQGTFLKYLGEEERLYPFRRVQKGEKLPPLFIVHGKDDVIVPVEGNRKFVDLVREKDIDAKVVFTIRDGDHGMSCEWGVEHEGLKEGLELAVGAWLG